MQNDAQPESIANLSQREGVTFMYQVMRVLFLSVVLIVILALQIADKNYINFQVFFSAYIFIGFSFFLHFMYLAFFSKSRFMPGLMFFVDLASISYMYLQGINSSFLVFLLLINIVLASFLFQRKVGVIFATITALVFAGLVISKSGFHDKSLILLIGFNNLTFFVAAYLSGVLSEQFNFLGKQLEERGKDIDVLKNLNALILRNMNSGLLTVDKHLKIMQVNLSATEILDIPRDRLMGQSVEHLFPFLEENPLFFSDHKVVGYEGEIIGHDQEPMIMRFNCSPLRGENNESAGFILAFDDVSRMKKLERQLRQNEKMAAIGQLAAGIAHEIRNPLASISGSVQLLADTTGVSSQDKKLFNIISREIDRLNLLITEFLDYAKPQAPLDEDVNLSKLVWEICEIVKVNDRLSEHIKQETYLQDDMIIKGNRNKLKQAILNIVINAYQAMNRRKEATFTAALARKNGKVLLTLSDNGEGIEPKVLKKVFEPFMTTKEKGTGLGLAITHSIFEHHKAGVEVTSSLGKGTTFHIQFPSA